MESFLNPLLCLKIPSFIIARTQQPAQAGLARHADEMSSWDFAANFQVWVQLHRFDTCYHAKHSHNSPTFSKTFPKFFGRSLVSRRRWHERENSISPFNKSESLGLCCKKVWQAKVKIGRLQVVQIGTQNGLEKECKRVRFVAAGAPLLHQKIVSCIR
jgi:hypothetical protein